MRCGSRSTGRFVIDGAPRLSRMTDGIGLQVSWLLPSPICSPILTKMFTPSRRRVQGGARWSSRAAVIWVAG